MFRLSFFISLGNEISVECTPTCASILMFLQELNGHRRPVNINKLTETVGCKQIKKKIGFWIKRGLIKEVLLNGKIFHKLRVS